MLSAMMPSCSSGSQKGQGAKSADTISADAKVQDSLPSLSDRGDSLISESDSTIFVLYAGAFYNEPEPLQTELELWTDHSFVLRQATSQYRDRIVGSYRIEQDTLYLKHSTGYTNYYLVEGDTLRLLNLQRVEGDMEYLLIRRYAH